MSALAQLRDLGRVDVEVDDGGSGRERRELAGDAVVEARADRHEHIAGVHGDVRPLRAVHARPAEEERVGLGERSLAHQGGDHGETSDLRQLAQLVARVPVDRAAADVQDGLLGPRDPLGGLADLERVHLLGRSPAGQLDRHRVAEVQLGLLDVPRHVDEDRAATAGTRNVERGLHHGRDLLHVLDEPGVLDDRHRDARDVAFLKRVGPDHGRAHLAGDADERRRIHPRIGDGGDEVGGPRTGRRDRDPDASRGACVPLRHVACALLVPGEHVSDRGPARHCVVRRHDRSARDAEHHLDALGFERPQNCVGSVHPHLLSFGLTVFRPFSRRRGGERCFLRRRLHLVLPVRERPLPSGGECQ